MGVGLKTHERKELGLILKKFLDVAALNILLAELDLIKKILPEEWADYKKSHVDSIPLKKGSDEYKALCKLNDDIGKLLLTLGNLPPLAENMVNYSLDGYGMIMLHIYGGKHKIASQTELLDSLEEYPPTLGMDLDQYSAILKNLQSAVLVAQTNSRLADKHLRGSATMNCLMLQKVRWCLMDHLGSEISYEGGSGTVFERVMSVMFGVSDSKDIIQNCDRK